MSSHLLTVQIPVAARYGITGDLANVSALVSDSPMVGVCQFGRIGVSQPLTVQELTAALGLLERAFANAVLVEPLVPRRAGATYGRTTLSPADLTAALDAKA